MHAGGGQETMGYNLQNPGKLINGYQIHLVKFRKST